MICLLSNININGQFLVNRLKKRTGHDVFVPPGYNTWVQDLLSENFLGHQPKAVFVVLDGASICDGLLNDRETLTDSLLGYVEILFGFTRKNPGIPLFVSSLDIPQKIILPQASRRLEAYAMSFWRGALEEKGLVLFDLAEIASRLGRETFYSPKMWFLGGLPFSRIGETALADEIVKIFKALCGSRKKCLLLDLDNTLWGGVVGEDGLHGLKLAPTNEGACFHDFQKRLGELRSLGIMLAVVSKNNQDEALGVIRHHPHMLLREHDFVAIKANWNPKSGNIIELSRELNLGLDAFVFVDDSPVEREEVKIGCPEVSVPDFPNDIFRLPEFARRLAEDYFQVLRLSAEDKNKTEQYIIENQRQSERERFIDLDDYLKSLRMRLTIAEVNKENHVRAAQLTRKTNQFNLTTRRYTEADMLNMLNEPDKWKMWLGDLADKFGNLGQIILGIAEIEGDQAELDTFLMSCRVMGRKVETVFLREIERILKGMGIVRLFGKYRPTGKNSVCESFYSQHGYKLVKSSEEIFYYETDQLGRESDLGW